MKIEFEIQDIDRLLVAGEFTGPKIDALNRQRNLLGRLIRKRRTASRSRQ